MISGVFSRSFRAVSGAKGAPWYFRGVTGGFKGFNGHSRGFQRCSLIQCKSHLFSDVPVSIRSVSVIFKGIQGYSRVFRGHYRELQGCDRSF